MRITAAQYATLMPSDTTGVFTHVNGPWQAAFITTVDVAPVTKSNYRQLRDGNTKKRWGRVQLFEATMAAAYHTATVGVEWEPGETSQKKVSDRPRFVLVVYADGLLDTPNLPKSVVDAGQTLIAGAPVLYLSDAQVVRTVAAVRRMSGGERVTVGVAQLAASNTVDAAADTATATLTPLVAATHYRHTKEPPADS